MVWQQVACGQVVAMMDEVRLGQGGLLLAHPQGVQGVRISIPGSTSWMLVPFHSFTVIANIVSRLG